MAIVHLHIYRKFDKIIVCSNFIADKIKASQLPISVIYTGVPSDYFVPLSDVERLNKRAELNISNKIKVWLFIGNLIPRKNPLFLISALKDEIERYDFNDHGRWSSDGRMSSCNSRG